MRVFVSTLVTALLCAGFAQAQDIDAGKKVFKKCRACHRVGPKAKNAVGPVLNGLFGRTAGTVEGYKYSKANKNSGIVWDDKTFSDYIASPRKFMPGTKMSFRGLKKPQDIKDLAAYLKQYGLDGQPAKN